MAKSSEKRSWRSGRSRQRTVKKKTASPSVAGVGALILLLAAVLIYALWPSPMPEVRLFVIAGDESPAELAEQLIRYETGHRDTQAMEELFSSMAEQIDQVVEARTLTPGEMNSLAPDQLSLTNTTAVVFLHAIPRVEVRNDDAAKLFLDFGSSKNSIAAEVLLEKFAAAGARHVVLLCEISQHPVDYARVQLTNDGPALLQELLGRLSEQHPDGSLTVICSTESGRTSFPALVAAESQVELQREQIEGDVAIGSAFAHSVAELFRTGQIKTVDDLTAKLPKLVEDDTQQAFGISQPVVVFGTGVDPESSPDIFIRNIALTEPADPESEEADDDEEPDRQNDAGSDVNASADQGTPQQQLAEAQASLEELLASDLVHALTIGELRQLQALTDYAEYCLQHGNVTSFRQTLDRLNRIQLQVAATHKSTIEGSSDSIELQEWIVPVSLAEDVSSAPFEEVLIAILSGEEVRDPALMKSLDSQETRQQLVEAFVAHHRILLDDIGNTTPEARKQREMWLSDLRNCFQRFTVKTGWLRSEWPHQFLLAEDVLQSATFEWSDAHFAAYCECLLLRTAGLQLASGIMSDAVSRMDAATFAEVETPLTELLIESAAAERWLLLGEYGVPLMEEHLGRCRRLHDEILRQLEAAQRRSTLERQHRLAVFRDIESLALQHDAVDIPTPQFASLAELSHSDLLNFQLRNIPAASMGLELPGRTIEAMLQLTEPRSAQSAAGTALDVALSRLTSQPTPLDSTDAFRTLARQHHGVWVTFWAIRSLAAMDETADPSTLFEHWRQFISAIAEEAAPPTIAARREALAVHIRQGWNRIRNVPVVPFQRPSQDAVEAIVGPDLARHARVAGGSYASRYYQLFGRRELTTSDLRFAEVQEDVRLQDGRAQLNLQLPPQTRFYFRPRAVRITQGANTDVHGWQTGTWQGQPLQLSALDDFTGVAQPILVAVDDRNLVHDFVVRELREAFQVDGWDLRLTSAGIPLKHFDFADKKVVTLPPVSSQDGLPLTLELIPPAGTFADSVLVKLMSVNDEGQPVDGLWTSFHKFQIDPQTRSAVLPLAEPVAVADGQPPPMVEGVDLTQGIICLVKPGDESAAAVEKSIRIEFEYVDPTRDYVDILSPSYDITSRILTLTVQRQESINPNFFPPKKMDAVMTLSNELEQYRNPGSPIPKSPDIPANGQSFRVQFQPPIDDAIREFEDEQQAAPLEFGMSIAGLNNAVKWKLGRTRQMERLGTSHRDVTDGTPVELRVGVEVANPPDDGIIPRQLNGVFVLADNWRNARLNFLVELYGFEDRFAVPSEVRLQLVRRPTNETYQFYPPLRLRNAYQRQVLASASGPGPWQLQITSRSHGEFNVDLQRRFNLGEGFYVLQASLVDLATNQERSRFEKPLILEDSPPQIVWDRKNSEIVRTSSDLTATIHVRDDQTGLVSIKAGLAADALKEIIPAPLIGQSRIDDFSVTIPRSTFPKIAAREFDVEQPLKVFIQATNGVGKSQLFEQVVTLVQPKIDMQANQPKKGNLKVTISSTSGYTVKLTGPGGTQVREGVKGSVTFSGLENGDYQLDWVKEYDNSKPKSPKQLKLQFQKNGQTHTESIR